MHTKEMREADAVHGEKVGEAERNVCFLNGSHSAESFSKV